MKNITSLDQLVPREKNRGDSDPFSYIAALRRYFQRRAAVTDVDDLVQDVFVSLHARRSEDPINNVGGYLFAIAANVLAQHRRRHAQSRAYFVLSKNSDAVAIDTISPEHTLICKSDLEIAVGILQSLPERTSEIFILHRFDGLTYSELATQFGISVSAVEKHMMRALAALDNGLNPPT